MQNQHQPAEIPSPSPVEQKQSPNSMPALNFGEKGKFRDQVWRDLLGWCQKELDLDWCFLTDERGLVIAEVNQPDQGLLETVASNIAGLAFSSILRRGEKMEILSIVFPNHWHGAMMLPASKEEQTRLVLGMVGKSNADLNQVKQAQELIKQALDD